MWIWSDLISAALEENQGGMKLMALIPRVVETLCKARIEVPDDLARRLLKSARESGRFGVLTYCWHISPELGREKYFIYTK